MMKELFTEKVFIKGNLHTHTTNSDGRRTPRETADDFKAHGYGFIALTDHNRYFSGWDEEDFVVLSGMEIDETVPGKTFTVHVVGVDFQQEPDMPQKGTYTIDEGIAALNAAGAFVILAHPHWSLMPHAEVNRLLPSCNAMEIYNGISDSYAMSRAVSSDYLDVAAANGLRPLISAADDCHFYDKDVYNGWVMVNTDKLNRSSIMEAIKAGRFYCSCGPEFLSIECGGGKVRVKCRGAKRVGFMSNAFWSAKRVVDLEPGQDTAEYTLLPSETYLRIELDDDEHRQAWSNLIDREVIMSD